MSSRACLDLFRMSAAQAMLDDVGQRPSSSGPFDPPFHVVALTNTIRFQGSAVIDGSWSWAPVAAMKLNQFQPGDQIIQLKFEMRIQDQSGAYI